MTPSAATVLHAVYWHAEAWLHEHAPQCARLAVEYDPGVDHVVGTLVLVQPGTVTARQMVDLRGYVRQAMPLDVWVRVAER